jgi:hypothetical protein
MNKILLRTENKTDVTIKEIDDKFHGKLIIHFANGVPKKIEVNKVEDITLS